MICSRVFVAATSVKSGVPARNLVDRKGIGEQGRLSFGAPSRKTRWRAGARLRDIRIVSILRGQVTGDGSRGDVRVRTHGFPILWQRL